MGNEIAKIREELNEIRKHVGLLEGTLSALDKNSDSDQYDDRLASITGGTVFRCYLPVKLHGTIYPEEFRVEICLGANKSITDSIHTPVKVRRIGKDYFLALPGSVCGCSVPCSVPITAGGVKRIMELADAFYKEHQSIPEPEIW